MKNRIRDDLWNGMSIDNVCRKYNIPFSILVAMMKQGERNNSGPKTRELYIVERDGRYHIRRANQYYGTYRTLSDAIKVRDWFIYNMFDKRKIDKACEECGVERYSKRGRY